MRRGIGIRLKQLKEQLEQRQSSVKVSEKELRKGHKLLGGHNQTVRFGSRPQSGAEVPSDKLPDGLEKFQGKILGSDNCLISYIFKFLLSFFAIVNYLFSTKRE